MSRADQIQMLSVALEALSEARKSVIATCSGNAEEAGRASADVTMAVIRAQTRVEEVMRELMQEVAA